MFIHNAELWISVVPLMLPSRRLSLLFYFICISVVPLLYILPLYKNNKALRVPFLDWDSACWMGGIPVGRLVQEQLHQDEEALIRYIQDHVLVPPDQRPYNLVSQEAINFSEYHTEPVLDILFDGKKQGIFFEAGAFNGENISNTLYLEKYHSWGGLLVEASPRNQQEIMKRHRKAWLARSCISDSDQPSKITFVEAGPYGYIDGYHDDLHNTSYYCPGIGVMISEHTHKDPILALDGGVNCTLVQTNDITAQCFPLYSLLLASGIVNIDFMSLDIQGVELLALKSLPFEKVNIKVLLVEHPQNPYKKKKLEDFIRSKGYNKLTDIDNFYRDYQFPMDMMFIKDGLSIPIV